MMLRIYLIAFACCLFEFVSCNIEVLRAINGRFVDQFQLQGALEIRTNSGLLECQAFCALNTECLSYFYNGIEKTCILHEDLFTYTQPTETGTGWNFFMTADGRCPPTDDFMYHRGLNLCFKVLPPKTIDFNYFKSTCQQYGAELVRIETEERQKFFETILAHENTNVTCVQGTDTIETGVWTFDDGTVMDYTNWDSANGQPDSNQGYLGIFKTYSFKWHDLGTTRDYSCLLICEKRV